MARSRTTIDEQFELVIQCRKSGMSDRDWCLTKGISQSTFYFWLRKLKDHGSYDIPESLSTTESPKVHIKQDVVKLNRKSEIDAFDHQTPFIKNLPSAQHPPITIEINGIKVNIENTADPVLLAQTLKLVRGILC